jgi:hypothetical protein
VRQYLDNKDQARAADSIEADGRRSGNYPLRVLSVTPLDENGSAAEDCPYGRPLRFRVEIDAAQDLGKPILMLTVQSAGTGLIFGANMFLTESKRVPVRPGRTLLECSFRENILAPGNYTVGFFGRADDGLTLLSPPDVFARFTVPFSEQRYGADGRFAAAKAREVGPVWLPHEWKIVE